MCLIFDNMPSGKLYNQTVYTMRCKTPSGFAFDKNYYVNNDP